MRKFTIILVTLIVAVGCKSKQVDDQVPVGELENSIKVDEDNLEKDSTIIIGITYGFRNGNRYRKDSLISELKISMGGFRIHEHDSIIEFVNSAGMLVYQYFKIIKNSIEIASDGKEQLIYEIEMMDETAKEWSWYQGDDFFLKMSPNNEVLTKGLVQISPSDSTIIIGWYDNPVEDFQFYEKYHYDLKYDVTLSNINGW